MFEIEALSIWRSTRKSTKDCLRTKRIEQVDLYLHLRQISLAAETLLLLWFYVTAYAVYVGAEIKAELELRAAEFSTGVRGKSPAKTATCERAMKTAYTLASLLWLLCITPARGETVLVTGSNRGIGLEFVKQYAARGWTVIATARTPGMAQELGGIAARYANVRIEALDVLDTAAVRVLAAKYASVPIDVLINNAGVLGDLDRQKLGALDYAEFQSVMGVNTYAPLAISDAFHTHVAASRQKKIVGITSGSGIISGPVGGGSYYYKASKIGLNMMFRALASDLAGEGVIVAVIAPGAVNTDMRRQAVGATLAARDMPVGESVEAMIKTIDALSRSDSGRAFNYDGRVLPW